MSFLLSVPKAQTENPASSAAETQDLQLLKCRNSLNGGRRRININLEKEVNSFIRLVVLGLCHGFVSIVLPREIHVGITSNIQEATLTLIVLFWGSCEHFGGSFGYKKNGIRLDLDCRREENSVY